jgi:hypothetical protein
MGKIKQCSNNNDDNNNRPKQSTDLIIQFHLILYYLCAESTATRPNADTAQR